MKTRHWLLQRAADSPEAEALCVAGRRLSYAELADRARRMARGLGEAGAEPGDLIAALLPNGLSFVVLYHAASLCGARFLPLNARLAARELAEQLRDSHASHLVHEGVGDAGGLADRARRAARSIPNLRVVSSPELERPVPSRALARALSEDVDLAATAVVLYTSGTSGRAKGVCLSHGNLLWSALASTQRLGSHTGDCWLACLPLVHVGGLSILARSALFGSAVRVHEHFDAARVSRALDEQGVTLLSLVPTMLRRLLEVRVSRAAPPGLRALLLGGAAAPEGLVRRARALGFPVLPTYGLTEAASQVTTATASDCEASPTGVGRPLFGTRIRIADSDGEALPAGREGEILVGGPTVMSGYLGDAQATGRALQGGWLHTGDIGVLDAEGRLRVLDRRRDLVVSGGENVYPAEVEAVLSEHPDVVEVAVTGVPDLDLGRRVGAWVVLRPGSPPSAGALRRFARERLAAYKVPKQFHFVTELPRNAAGKLLRARLPEMDAATQTPDVESAAG